jgi:hypothetical protein
MFWAFFDEKNVFSYYCDSRFWHHRDPGSEVFQHRNPGSEKERRDCKACPGAKIQLSRHKFLSTAAVTACDSDFFFALNLYLRNKKS